MPKTLAEMASEIVVAQASHTPMTSEEIANEMRRIFEVLQSLHALETDRANDDDVEGRPKLLPQHSIQRHRVICLECSKDFKLLSNRHLALYGLTSLEYKIKYGIPLRQPLSAKSLTQMRRKIAKEKGLGEKLVAYRRQRQRARHSET